MPEPSIEVQIFQIAASACEALLREVALVLNTLAEEVKRDSKDSKKLNAIQGFLENCYEISSLGLVRQRLADISKLQEEVDLQLRQALFHSARADQVVGDKPEEEILFLKSEEKILFFFEEASKFYLSLQQYKKNKVKKFDLLRNLIEEFWSDLPSETQQTFEVWAKDLTILVAQEGVEDRWRLAFQDLLEVISGNYKAVAIEETVNRLKQLMDDTENVNIEKAILNFIASIFRQGVTAEEEALDFSGNKNAKKLSEEQIHKAGMKAFEELLEDYGDVVEALAEH
jgi:hypothetical protein